MILPGIFNVVHGYDIVSVTPNHCMTAAQSTLIQRLFDSVSIVRQWLPSLIKCGTQFRGTRTFGLFHQSIFVMFGRSSTILNADA